MTGNPKSSPWYATPAAKRKRKPITVTLSDEAREGLNALAAKYKLTVSGTIEALVKAAVPK